MRATLAVAVLMLVACRSGPPPDPLDRPLCEGSATAEARKPTIPLDPIHSEVDAREWCLPSGWCWWNFPRGVEVTGIWGSGPSDVWATTAVWDAVPTGAMLHFDGSRWSAIGIGRPLLSVWGVDPREAYAVGYDGTTLRWDGAAWSELTNAHAPWGDTTQPPDPSDVSAFGRIAFAPVGAALARFDGERWSVTAAPDRPDLPGLVLSGTWAAGPDEAFATGWADGAPAVAMVLRLQDGRWDVRRSEIRASSVNGSSPRDVWVSAWGGVIQGVFTRAESSVERFDGSTWRAAPPTAVGPQGGPFFPAPRDVWLGDFRLEGACWKQHAGPVFRLRWASGANDIWGTNGLLSDELVHWDGTRWATRVRLRAGLQLLGEAGPSDAWALALVDEGWILAAWDGATWSAVPGSLVAGTGGGGAIRGRGFGTSSTDVWLASWDGTFLHWDGAAWTRDVAGAPITFAWNPPFSGSGPRDVWAWNGGTYHWDGDRWTELPSPGDVFALWVPALGTVFALGSRELPVDQNGDVYVQDVIWRWDGARWAEELAGATRVQSPTGAPYGMGTMWGAAPDDGWAVLNALYHWDGAAWTRFEGAPLSSAQCMWGTATDDVWALWSWYPASTWHWDGTAWTQADAPGCGTGRWVGGGSLWRRSVPGR